MYNKILYFKTRNKVTANKKNIYFLAVFSVTNGTEVTRDTEKENLTQ